MTISEDLREMTRQLRESEAFSCWRYMEGKFGIECEGAKCSECYARLFENIADRIDAERALPEGIEWPRFEDGEPVSLGDEVEFEDEAGIVACIRFELLGWSMTLNHNLSLSYLSGAFGERVKRYERPKPVIDASGETIEVGDTVYLRSNGREGEVVGFYKEDGKTWVSVSYKLGSDIMTVNTEGKALTHKRPDSWEQLEKDAYHLVMSEYLDTPDEDVRDIVRRAKALAKAGEEA